MQRKELKLSSAVSANSAVKKKNMEMKRKNESRNTNHEPRLRVGSALILAVVLTSLLAIVGVMFVMVARVDRIATSAISENKELNSAVETVIAKISQELVLDVPRLGQEYYDYPDAKNAWLASLEPYEYSLNNYRWRQISDVTGFLADNNYDADDVDVKPVGLNTLKYVREYPEIRVNSDGKFLDKNGNIANEGLSGDADGDGVADSKWIELDDITSNKGKPIYAAIRIIDNGAMLNVNTAYKFDPNETDKDLIDGSSQTQINLAALSQRGANGTLDNAADNLQFVRCGRGSEPYGEDDIPEYERDVVWRYYQPAKGTKYTPFDISDELELRNRFLLEFEHIDTRIEEEVWDDVFTGDNYLHVPVGQNPKIKLADWFARAQYDLSEPNATENYSYRHIGTTYNMDRIIHPYGGKMFNINMATAANKDIVHGMIAGALIGDDFNSVDVNNVSASAAQIAVNLIDFRDNDPNVTTLDVNGITYYGFERPCVYISELAHKFLITDVGGGPVESDTWRSYAVELYKPYPEDDYPDSNEWRLFIDNSAASPPGDVDVPVDWSGTQRFHVIKWENTHTELDVDFDSDPLALSDDIYNLYNKIFDKDSIISLQRRVDADWISVDSIEVPRAISGGQWLIANDGTPVSIQRDITLHKCIRRLWSGASYSPTLGRRDNGDYETLDSIYIQAHPEDKPFTNVGEIEMVFREDVYRRNWDDTDTEADVRLDLADPNYHNIFQYLTVFDPSSDGINNDGDRYTSGIEIIDEFDDNGDGYPDPGDELKIPGRININTAPWYVIAQLPWMTDKIAQAIVAYRDKAVIPDQNNINYDDRENATNIPGISEEAGFASIGELATVVNDSGKDEYNMRYYTLGAESDDLLDYPDLSYADEAPDDFEERDVIFARISNLVTVRSDVFTAYILVRIGADGPQKRVMAILDRSNVYFDDGRVQLVALHAVPDPR